MKGTMMRTPLLMSTLLDRGVQIQPDNLIITKTRHGYSSLTYSEHFVRVKKLANALHSIGVRRGDRVATLCWNTNRHYQCYHSVPSMGAVLHTLNVRLGPKELGYIIKFAQDKVVIVDADLLPSLAKVDPKDMRDVQFVVVCGEDERPGGWQGCEAHRVLQRGVGESRVVDWDDFLHPQPATFHWPTDLDENDALSICFTSGTTGNPKGVVYTHRGQYVHTLVMSQRDAMNIGGADVLMPVVPYFHANGWGLAYCALMMGARVVHNGRYTDADSLLKMSIDHGVTFSAGVPTVWQTVRARLEDPSALDLCNRFAVKQIVCGGSAPPLEMMRWYWDTFGTEFVQAWGMTETSPLGTVARQVTTWEDAHRPVEKQFENVDAAGIPLATVQMRIVDTDNFDKELSWDGEDQGELLVRGPHVTGSYFRNPQPSKFHKGWLATGDIASISSRGQMRIRDRSKDVIKSGGEWISSVDLEKHIMAMPQVSVAAVVAAPHPKWDERPIVVAVLAQGYQTLSLEDVRAFCSKEFAKYELPDDLLIWPSLPLTGSGKMDKKCIRKRLKERGYRLPSLREKKSKL